MALSLPTPRDAKRLIKLAIMHDERVSTRELKTMMADHDIAVSGVLVSGVARAFRDDLRLLRSMGLLDEIDKDDLTPLPRAPRRDDDDAAPSFYYRE